MTGNVRDEAMTAPLDASLSNPREGAATFPLRHRLYRLVWALVWKGVGIWTPAPLHAWRNFLVRRFGGRIARTAKIYPGVQIWYPPHLGMEDYSCLGPRAVCYSMAPITLGAYALISQGAHLCAGTHDIDDPYFQLKTRPIVIAANAWVAAEAFVGPGVTIAEGAVLGARAVAFRDLEAWTVYIGNPAQPLRARRRSGVEQSGTKTND
jgi:putative colanic acid biosynthesis acetyltransferase WcaF